MLANSASSTSVFHSWNMLSLRIGRDWRDHMRAAGRLVGVSCLCLVAAGCLPGDGADSESDAPSLSFPISNLDDKGDRWDLDPVQQGDAAAPQPYKVATTATVVPTSAPAEQDATTGNAFPKVADLPASKALKNFFDALAALDRGDRKKPVTIVHIGDGHIAADRFTSTLRGRLQARFGDAGRGLMAPGLFRVAEAEIARNGNWTTASSAATDAGPFGLAGVRLTGREGATLEVAMPRAPFDWAEIMFASTPKTGKVRVEVDGKGDTVGTSTMEPTWQRIRIKAGGSQLKLRVEGGGPVHILSLATGRDAPGVRYINLGVPKATALTPKRWDEDIVAAELKHLSPDLVVVGYGTNEAFDDQLDSQEYSNEFRVLLTRLKAAAPDSALVVIGPPDVAYIPRFAAGSANDACRALSEAERIDYSRLVRERSPRLGRWHPPLKLRSVRQAARYAASAAGAYFWNWSATMGGPCSIHAWAHTQPPLASASHRHFTREGASHSAEALFRDLLSGYEQFRSSARAAKASE